MRTRTSWLAALTALGAALLATSPVPAQDPSSLHVRCVSVLASGGPREKGVVPQFSQIDPWAQKELEKLPDARFESWASTTFCPLKITTKWSPFTVTSNVFHAFGLILASCGALPTFTTLPVRKSPLL